MKHGVDDCVVVVVANDDDEIVDVIVNVRVSLTLGRNSTLAFVTFLHLIL